MLRSFLVSALRNLYRNKVQSFVQILSLAIGLSVFSLVAIYLFDELTIDRSNPYFQTVYRADLKESNTSGAVDWPLGPIIEDELPEILNMTRVRLERNVPLGSIREDGEIIRIKECRQMLVDSGFQKVFPQIYLAGDPNKALTKVDDIVLTETIARKLFGNENPLGRSVYVWLGTKYPKTVVGVVRDPGNVHLKFDFLTHVDNKIVQGIRKGRIKTRKEFHTPASVYIRVGENTDLDGLEEKIARLWSAYMESIGRMDKHLYKHVVLHSLKELSSLDMDPFLNYMRTVDHKTLKGFFLLGLAALVMGIINYMNLATARASARAREIAQRQICGANRKQLIFYFLTESILTSFLSFLVAITLIQLVLTPFARIIQADMELFFLFHPLAWGVFLLLILITGILAGIWPALFLSSGYALQVFQGGPSGKGTGLLLRRTLMILQFCFSIVLLVSILSIQRQVRQMKLQDPGFTDERVYYYPEGNLNKEQKQELIRRVRNIPEIQNITFSLPVPGALFSEGDLEFDQPGSIFHGMRIKPMNADPEFFKTYGLNLIYGSEFLDQEQFKNYKFTNMIDSLTYYCVINESCFRLLNIDDPVNYRAGPNYYIAGVVEDFHFQSLKYPIRPMIIWLSEPGASFFLSISTDSPDPNSVFQQIHQLRSAIRQESGIKFERTLMQEGQEGEESSDYWNNVAEVFRDQYEEEERIQSASLYLAILTTVLAILGLFGLSSFIVQRKVKEIGIRKAMGSSVGEVLWLVIKDLLMRISLALAIGLPIGWWLTSNWQQQFAFKSGQALWIYLTTIGIVVLAALATVARQVYRTSRANPADVLRTE